MPGWLSPIQRSDAQVGEGMADRVDYLDQPRVALLKTFYRRAQTLKREIKKLWILGAARGLVRGNLREPCDALRPLDIGLREFRNFGAQRAQKVKQLLPPIIRNGLRACDARLDPGEGFVNHCTANIPFPVWWASRRFA